MKIIFDITIMVFLIPVFLFFFPIIYLLIIISDGYPAIYVQERVGKNDKIFKLFNLGLWMKAQMRIYTKSIIKN